MKTLAAAIPFIAIISSLPAFAGVPDAVTYAGTLNQGSAPANGTFTVVLGLFDAQSDGNRVFQQTEVSLAVSQGEFAVDLGIDPTNPLSDDVLKGGPLFLDITINGEELTPRIPFTSVPFARVAKQAEHATKADDADTLGGLAVDDILNVLTAGDGVQRIGDRFSLEANGVTGAHLANGAVAGRHIADHAVTSSKITGVKVLAEPKACGGHLRVDDGSLTCKSEACVSTFGPAFRGCDGTCGAQQAQTCNLSTAGFLVQ